MDTQPVTFGYPTADRLLVHLWPLYNKLIAMPNRNFLLVLLPCFISIGLFAQTASYTRAADGLILSTDGGGAGPGNMIRLRVVTDRIIRVTVLPRQMAGRTGAGIQPDPAIQPESAISQAPAIWDASQSLIAVYGVDSSAQWDIKESPDSLSLITRQLIAHIGKHTGGIRYTDPDGHPIASEKASDGRSLTPTFVSGQPAYRTRQTFTTSPGEALYGLGQHQDGVLNYKRRQVQLWQNNSEVAVPLLVSSNHYGILWDNYSLTTAGDPRPYMPLSRLRLVSGDGKEGWLTASYANDKDQPQTIQLVRAESGIDMPWLGDSKTRLPAAFLPAKGSVTWTGSIGSQLTGEHLFRLTYGGYCKIWLDGRLVLDRWRQAWNPASALLRVNLEKGRQVPLKIEWRPDGDESYISLNWQAPPDPGSENDFSFVSEAGHNLDYYLIAGDNIDEVIAGYRHITGKSTLAPRWAMGLWQSRERYKTQDELLDVVKEFRKRSIPLDNIVQDWSYWRQNDWGSQDFDPSRFPAPDSMIDVLHRNYHAKFMISVWPKFYQGIPAYDEFERNGWLYKRNIADSQRDWIAQGYISTFYDAFNPGARKGFWDLLDKKLYRKGIDAWWMDASEPDILSNVSPEKRKLEMEPTALGPAALQLNAYPLENARGIYEGQRSVNPDQRVFILTRSAFAGSQRYAAAVWSGDIASRWEDMHTQIAAGVNFSLSGIPYWTMDIGGFAVEHRYEHPNAADLEEWREQTTRWYQFGAFCPLFRVHGQFPFREIYHIAPDDHPAYHSMLYYDQLRYRLQPYLYSLSGMTWYRDYTMMRGLVMDFGKDSLVHDIDDQFMLGPSFMAAPVTTFHATERSVYLPAGADWYDLYTGRSFAGGQTIKAAAPYEKMPVFVRSGSIIPTGPDLQYTGQHPADPITLYVYTGEDGSFSLYEDENTNYNYEKGKYAIIPFSYKEASHTLTIGARSGSFTGMLKNRSFRIIHIGKDKALPLNTDAQPDAVIHYKGKQLSVHIP